MVNLAKESGNDYAVLFWMVSLSKATLFGVITEDCALGFLWCQLGQPTAHPTAVRILLFLFLRVMPKSDISFWCRE